MISKINNSKNVGVNFDWINYTQKDIENIVSKTKNLIEVYKKYIQENFLNKGEETKGGDSLDKKEKTNKRKGTVISFANFIHVGEILGAEIGKLGGIIFAYSQLSTDENLRNISMKVEIEMGKILNTFSYDEEVYKVFLNYYKNNYKQELKKKVLTQEQIKIVEDSNKGYIKMGMHLDKKTKKDLLNKQNKLNKIAQEFEILKTKNYEIGLWFKKEKLTGVADEYFKNFKYDEAKKMYFINCSGSDGLGTDYPIIKKYCSVKETREKCTHLNEAGIHPQNTSKMSQILKIRKEIIDVLGYKTWSEFATEHEMMSDTKTINTFLEDLIKKISPKFEKQIKNIEKVLHNKDKNLNENLSTASFAYGEKILKNKENKIDENLYKPYFELEKVLQVLFSIWEKYFDIKTEYLPDIKVMHEEAKTFKFTDIKSGDNLGHGVMDLFPRKRKYGHACVADIFKKYLNLDMTKNPGFTFLICNFQKGQDKTFISLSDMNTLFHEAGHMLHMILMKNNYPSTGSTSRDFVEIPSQFHENFLMDTQFVQENFKHFETGERMPKNLLENIKNISGRGETKTWVRTSMAALFDQEIHGKNILKYADKESNSNNLDIVFEKLWAKYYKVKTINKNRHYPSTFSYLVGGYDARYYSYVISRVYAQDFWQEFSKGGIKKGVVSEKYKKFLEAGGTKKENEIVKDFLKRKVSMKPFLELLK